MDMDYIKDYTPMSTGKGRAIRRVLTVAHIIRDKRQAWRSSHDDFGSSRLTLMIKPMLQNLKKLCCNHPMGDSQHDCSKSR